MADPKTPRSRNPSRGQRGAQKTEPPRASEREGGSARDGDERGDGRGLLTGNDFPILTEEVDLDQLTKPTLPRGGTSSTGEIVERALRGLATPEASWPPSTSRSPARRCRATPSAAGPRGATPSRSRPTWGR